MIITKLQGGLGNQLFQYAIGRRFAIDGNTFLKVNIENFDRLTNTAKRNYKLNVFQVETTLASKADEISVLGAPFFQPIKRRFWKMGIDIFNWNYLREESYTYHPEILKNKKNIYLDGYWQCPLYFESIRAQLLNELSLKPEFRTKEFLNKLAEIKSTKSIAIHVRRGDYATNTIVNKQFGMCSIDYYNAAMQYLSNKLDKPTFFVFSDDIPWCKENLIATDCNIQYVTDFADYEDLLLMSACENQIISNSTFSWWAAWLNKNESKLIIAPKVWYLDPTLDTSKLIPNEWLRM